MQNEPKNREKQTELAVSTRRDNISCRPLPKITASPKVWTDQNEKKKRGKGEKKPEKAVVSALPTKETDEKDHFQRTRSRTPGGRKERKRCEEGRIGVKTESGS